ncbi:MAG: hypothetical protein PHW21_06585 [Candidatus Izemoplasmatales bacterium]|nr:hypothetical protein [Candidatus Izemoplasmatales bacterium]HHT82572.1 hypothetical protein [Acholeplasmataceae bacterium]
MYKIKINIIFLFFFLLMLSGCKLKKEETIHFIETNTSLSYSFFANNINPEVTFDSYNRVDFENGYDLTTIDGSETYRFINIEKYGKEPVMSYYSANNNNVENISLFGIKIGDVTKVYKNSFLNVSKDYSLIDFLIKEGFEYNYDKAYINQGYQTINGVSVNWVYLIKDDIFINIALEAVKGLNLAAFEIGINTDEVINKLIKDKEGYEINIIDEHGLLFGNYSEKYQFGSLINFKVLKPNIEKTPKLYINNEFIKEFSFINNMIYDYETFVFMPPYDVEVEIRLS